MVSCSRLHNKELRVLILLLDLNKGSKVSTPLSESLYYTEQVRVYQRLSRSYFQVQVDRGFTYKKVGRVCRSLVVSLRKPTTRTGRNCKTVLYTHNLRKKWIGRDLRLVGRTLEGLSIIYSVQKVSDRRRSLLVGRFPSGTQHYVSITRNSLFIQTGYMYMKKIQICRFVLTQTKTFGDRRLVRSFCTRKVPVPFFHQGHPGATTHRPSSPLTTLERHDSRAVGNPARVSVVIKKRTTTIHPGETFALNIPTFLLREMNNKLNRRHPLLLNIKTSSRVWLAQTYTLRFLVQQQFYSICSPNLGSCDWSR